MAKSVSSTKAKPYAVFCDDVRQESNGKFFLIGVYGNELNMNSGPGPLPIAAWIQVPYIPLGDHHVKIALRKHVGKQSTEAAIIEGEVKVLQAQLGLTLVLPIVPVHVDSDCKLSIWFNVGQDEPVKVGELDVKAHFAR